METITSTRLHPFFVEGKGFVPAGGLAVGNSIVTRAGPALVVKEVKWLRKPQDYDVYNFVVQDDHTYFVGNSHGGAWVHNVECPRPNINTKLSDRVTKALPAGGTRSAEENKQARNFFKNYKEEAQKWWECRTGKTWPTDATHAEHTRPLKDGGILCTSSLGFDGPTSPHMSGDFQRWGAMGGRPSHKPKQID